MSRLLNVFKGLSWGIVKPAAANITPKAQNKSLTSSELFNKLMGALDGYATLTGKKADFRITFKGEDFNEQEIYSIMNYTRACISRSNKKAQQMFKIHQWPEL